MTPEQATDRQTFTASIGDFKQDEVAKTILRNTGAGGETQNPAWVIEPAVYESHPQDSRITGPVDQSPTVVAKWAKSATDTTLVQQAFRKSRRAQSTDDFETWVDDGVANTVNCFDQGDIRTTHAVAVQDPMAFSWQGRGDMRGAIPRPTAQLQRCQIEAVLTPMAVRRLTPVECERLQGFPDGWTDIKPGGKDTPDSPRYKALGNSMAVPVMRWIGERIEAHK